MEKLILTNTLTGVVLINTVGRRETAHLDSTQMGGWVYCKRSYELLTRRAGGLMYK